MLLEMRRLCVVYNSFCVNMCSNFTALNRSVVRKNSIFSQVYAIFIIFGYFDLNYIKFTAVFPYVLSPVTLWKLQLI